MNIRAFVAMLLCKTLRTVLRLFNRGGTAMPGRCALKICPELLKIISKDVKTVAVTGTNGKTTSSRMIEQAFKSAGKDYFANRSGANLITGITTEFVMNTMLLGKAKKHYAVIECDEAAAKKVFGQIKPQVIVVTNIFRDQLDRYGEITSTLNSIKEGILHAPDATLCLNADCSLTASIAGTVPNKIVYFGVNKGAVDGESDAGLSDAAYCIKCKSKYEFDYITYGHLGGFRCPSCGYKRHAPDVFVESVTEMSDHDSRVMIRMGNQPAREFLVNLPAVYNIYNAVGALAACTEMNIDKEIIADALSSFKCGFGRMEHFDIGNTVMTMLLIKNPAGCNRALEFISGIEENFVLAVCLNDRSADGTDISWIWDSKFETLGNMKDRISKLYVCGDRAEDMLVRIKYAGFPIEKAVVEHDYEKLLNAFEAQEEPVYVIPTYTAMLELRKDTIKRCGGEEFWEG